MSRLRVFAAGALVMMLLPTTASARVFVGVGVGGYYPAPYYAPYYYPQPYYYPPAYYYAPPPVIEQPVITAPAENYWYWCPSAKAYYPYVSSCPEGWQAVPATSTRASVPAAPAPASAGGKITFGLGDVLFASGKAELRPEADTTLGSLLETLAKYPDRRILVEGHTDNVGADAANLALSQQRAESVKRYLAAHGIAESRIQAVGKGKAGPVESNDSEWGRQRNRRVDVIIAPV